MEDQTAQQRYEQMVSDRQPYLDRARECAKVTIPLTFPPEGHNQHSRLKTPYQSVGARGVNNLASKLILALLPANTVFFKLSLDDFTLQELTGEEGARAEVEEALNKIERAVQTEIEGKMVRVTVGQALKELIVAGNSLLYLTPADGIRAYTLDHYVCRRDPFGNPLEIITMEEVGFEALPEDMQEKLKKSEAQLKTEKTVKIYTRVYFEGGKWHSYQEVEGEKVPGTEGTYKRGKLPWIPLRLSKIDGEHYGRGYVEEYLGDLKTLEALTKAVTEGSAAAARVLFMLDPNGTTRAKQLTEAENLSVITGRAQDVSTLRLEKYGDFRVALETANVIEQRLSRSFLMESSVQRNAERVTAEEIRYMAGELDDGMGGIYSLLSQELQLPLVKALMHDMETSGVLPALPEGVVEPHITAGMEALGRGHDLNKLNTLVQLLSQLQGVIPPEEIAQRVNLGDFIKRAGTGLGIDMDGLIYTEEQVQQKRQQDQMQQLQAEGASQIMAQSQV